MEQKKLHTLFGSEIIFSRGEMPKRRSDERRPTSGAEAMEKSRDG
jgi:hypothetical protein